MKGLMGKKVGMSQIWTDDGKKVPVTVVQAFKSYAVRSKNTEKEGYSSIQFGFNETKKEGLSKPVSGLQKELSEKANVYVTEFYELRDFSDSIEPGQSIDASVFEQGEKVSVRSMSKGKGFQGVVKRYGFHGGRKTHGSHFHRAPGSVGAGTYPGEVVKGKKMPGRAGGKNITIRNVEIVRVNAEDNILLLKGSIPGSPGRKVFVYQK